MTQRVGSKGQVVIPKAIRDELGLQPGAEVVLERDGAHVRIVPELLDQDVGCRVRDLRADV